MEHQYVGLDAHNIDAMENCCPVCFYELERPNASAPPINAMRCNNKHWVCVRCVQKMVDPVKVCSKKCSGFHYTCPLCRAGTCMHDVDVLVVMRGSWKDAGDCFQCTSEICSWECQRTAVQC